MRDRPEWDIAWELGKKGIRPKTMTNRYILERKEYIIYIECEYHAAF